MEQTIKVYLTQMGNNKKRQEQEGLRFEADKPGNDGNEGNVLNVYDQVEYQDCLLYTSLSQCHEEKNICGHPVFLCE